MTSGIFTIQSISQSITPSDFYSANISGGGRLIGDSAESLSNEKNSCKQFKGPLGVLVFMEDVKSNIWVSRRLMNVAVEGVKCTDSARLFHGEEIQEQDLLVSALVFTLETVNYSLVQFQLARCE